MDKTKRIKELIGILNEAGRSYYAGDKEIMTNYEYDALYDELAALEAETGIVMSDSPTQHVGYETVSELPKEEHAAPMLSLDKTKSVDALAAFAGAHKCLLSWKLDGLTVVLTYEHGELIKAVTRGNGYIGEVITANARTFKNLPTKISYQGRLVIRGEAIITYSDFERINALITNDGEKYKNPRNLCSGSVRQLNSEITAKRNVRLKAFALISAVNPETNEPDVDFGNSKEGQFNWLKSQGFDTVDFRVVDESNMAEAVGHFAKEVEKNDFPSDGLVLTYDDIAYGESLGRTAKFPRHSIAFKWKDELVDTKLLEIEWSASRTGLINPVAIFEPVEIEGTTVSRASVHNVSILRALGLGLGDIISVYKANMIIPQIAKVVKKAEGADKLDDGEAVIPDTCPVCGGRTELRSQNDALSLYCTNPECQAKQVKSFELLVSRDALNIDGISEATLEKFIDDGMIRTYADIYHLERYRERICTMEGFGEKSFDNMMNSIEKSRDVQISRFIYALGIPGVGVANAKLICRHFDSKLDAIISADENELMQIDGIGAVIAGDIVRYFSDEKKRGNALMLARELRLIPEEKADLSSDIAGKTFVITGSVEHFANRNEIKALIEGLGGKVAGSVSSKTDYLINNDTTSNSSKNQKAKELGIPIISEEDFINMTGKKED